MKDSRVGKILSALSRIKVHFCRAVTTQSEKVLLSSKTEQESKKKKLYKKYQYKIENKIE